MKLDFQIDNDDIISFFFIAVITFLVGFLIAFLMWGPAYGQTQTEYVIGIDNTDYTSKTTWETFVADGYAKSIIEMPYHANTTKLSIHSWFDNIYIGLQILFLKDINKGIGYDSDYLYSILYYKSKFDNTVKLNAATFMAGYRFNNTTLYANFNSFKQMNFMDNGFWCIYYSWFWGIIQVNEPIRGLNSHYNIRRNTFGIGLMHKEPLSNLISLYFNGKYNWLGSIETRGWWNLRKLIFEQKSSRPNLACITTGISFTPIKEIEINTLLYLNYFYAKMTNIKWSEPVRGKEVKEFPVYIKSFDKGMRIGLFYKGILK